MKNISYQAKSTIFLLLSVVVAVAHALTDWWGLSLLGDILWGVGLFYWGAQVAQQRERAKAFRKLAWRSGPTVVG